MTWLDSGGQRSRSRQAVKMVKAAMSMLGHQSTSSSFCLHYVCEILCWYWVNSVLIIAHQRLLEMDSPVVCSIWQTVQPRTDIMIAEITTSPLLEVQSIVISVSVCLFVCLLTYVRVTPWPWLRSHLMAMQYIMYFWFCEWHNIMFTDIVVNRSESKTMCVLHPGGSTGGKVWCLKQLLFSKFLLTKLLWCCVQPTLASVPSYQPSRTSGRQW